jgi:hypothetical protein
MIDGQDRPKLPSAIERLAATGPFAPDQQDLMLYGRLVGAWDVEWVRQVGGKPAEHRRAEWHFAWVLGGRGVQDVIWRVGDARQNDGTTLRCWDRELSAWRVAFMSPGDGEFVTLLGRPEGDRIVQDVIDRSPNAHPDGHAERWTFAEITETSFLWQAERSSDGWRSWDVTHEMRASRRAE